MKYVLYALVAAVIVLLLFYAGVFGGLASKGSDDRQAERGRWERKTDDTPPVTVAVTPTELAAGASHWKFRRPDV